MMTAQRFNTVSARTGFFRCAAALGLIARLGAAVTRATLLAVVGLACMLAPCHAGAAELITGLGGDSGFGNLAMGRNDDGSSASIAFGAGFPHGLKLFSGTYKTGYINNNGNITFSAGHGPYTPVPFPVTNLPMLAAYWGDVDTRGTLSDPLRNNVYYSTALAGKFIVTWHDVGYYSNGVNKLNAFQMVLTDRKDVAEGDFDIEYRYSRLEWTTGGASGGTDGLGGTPAQMGYDAGDGKNFFRHADSGTAAILTLVETSNVGVPGVWRFEVRGGNATPVRTPILVDVRLIQTLNASDIAVDPASFVTPPQSVTTANGRTVIEWGFAAFPADITKDLSFDIVFKNPVGGERREVVSKLELLYKDVNGNPVRTELGAQFVNVHPSVYQVTPSSDKALYGPNEPVLISSAVKNLSAASGSTAVRLSILDSSNAFVAMVGTLPAQTVEAGAVKLFGALSFPSGTTYVGNYKILAELLDPAGKVVASGTSSFAIGAAAGQNAKVAIVSDKQVYQPFETVRLSDLLVNQLVNASIDDLRIQTVVRNPDNSVRMTRTEVLAQLPPSGVKDYAYSVALGWAAIGRYTATVTVTRADGSVLAQALTTFSVASSADSGAGLTGSITAAPASAASGQTIKLAFNATNNGNAALVGLPMTVSIIDPDLQQVVASYPYAGTLAIGGVYEGTSEWVALAGTGGNYVAVLSARVGAKDLTLAQVALRVITLDSTQTRQPVNRVLALVSCREGEDDTKPGAACLSARAQTIAQALEAARVTHTIVSDELAFKKALRSGLYNTYWLSGKQGKLHGQLANELKQAVFGGDSALIDSEHDQRNGLDAMAGIRWNGKYGTPDLNVDIAGPVFSVQQLATVGRSGRVLLAGGTQHAAFNAGRGADGAAIIGNQFGAGRVVQYTFDLPFSLRAYAQWQAVLETSLKHVQTAPADIVIPGAVVPVKLALNNRGPAAAFSINSVLPLNSAYLGSSPDASVDAGTGALSWLVSLDAQQSWDGLLSFRAPPAAGPAVLRTVVSLVDPASGSAAPFGDPLVLTLNVVDATKSAAQARAALMAYAPLARKDSNLRDKLAADVTVAMSAFNLNTAAGYDDAIAQLLDVIDQLSGLPTVNTRPVQDSLHRIVREAQWRWSQAAKN
ncbi:nidogen-like domain-containing protein [Massilia sp. CCM 9210]|uniref:nidogen-like domain-containing protein n=1 Tax=Massilia scottii TaxID=3057166 RepID=UPI0027967CDB|nr:nidogen-like domain-containing protein [Massilia sp. CCM 9210]MDQ1813393.1 nidogen-like domain-containing protein [Massilia sp. CCM 9210]